MGDELLWVERLDDRADDGGEVGEVAGNQGPADWAGEVASDARLDDDARRRLGLLPPAA
jgi:hypothetical protein